MFDKFNELVNKINWITVITIIILSIILYSLKLNNEFFSPDYINDSLRVKELKIGTSTSPDNVPWSIRQENGHFIIRRSGGPFGGFPKISNGIDDSDKRFALLGSNDQVNSVRVQSI